MSAARKHLRVVRPDPKAEATAKAKSRRMPPRVAFASALALGIWLAYAGSALEGTLANSVRQSVRSLTDASDGSREAFQIAKGHALTHLASAMRSPLPAVRASAETYAVYFFPELLDETDFEKAEALSIWQPLAQKIELEPHSAEARRSFQHLEAALSVYESGSSGDGARSPAATLYLRVYERLSRP